MKFPAMSPKRKDPNLNQYSNRIINAQDPILPPLLEKYPTGYKTLLNDTHYPNKTKDNLNDSTDNSGTEVDDYFNKLNFKKGEDKDNEYKYYTSQDLNSSESVINKTESEEALNDHLMTVNSSIKVVNNVIGNISLCKIYMIEFIKIK